MPPARVRAQKEDEPIARARLLTIDHGGLCEPSMVDTETWNVGGMAGGLQFGLSYQF